MSRPQCKGVRVVCALRTVLVGPGVVVQVRGQTDELDAGGKSTHVALQHLAVRPCCSMVGTDCAGNGTAADNPHSRREMINV